SNDGRITRAMTGATDSVPTTTPATVTTKRRTVTSSPAYVSRTISTWRSAVLPPRRPDDRRRRCGARRRPPSERGRRGTADQVADAPVHLARSGRAQTGSDEERAEPRQPDQRPAREESGVHRAGRGLARP